jgi:long-chain acyl-CoA synthetase
LSAYKVPRIIRFVHALPKGPSGKILKRSIDRTELTREPGAGDVPAHRH